MHTMRWFGPDDSIKLKDLRQCGIKNIVTALHDINVGEVLPITKIQSRIKYIESYNLKWLVVESLPVSEDIKRMQSDFKRHITNYKKSIHNLAQ
tara:strand:- start:934 stop:1215 length:282 start_codon:yes stop_codon:yes gene_type:complete